MRDRTDELEAALRLTEKITRELRDSEAKFHGVVNQSLVGIAIIERDGGFAYTNPRLAEMFGYTAQEAAALSLMDIIPEEERPTIAENLRKRLSGEEAIGHYVTRGVRKDGGIIDRGGVCPSNGTRRPTCGVEHDDGHHRTNPR